MGGKEDLFSSDRYKQVPDLELRFLEKMSEINRRSDWVNQRFLETLLRPEKIVARIVDIERQLRQYRVLSEDCTSPKAREGWEQISRFLEDTTDLLSRGGFSFFVCGSIIYDDPTSEMDVDGVFITEDLVEGIDFGIVWRSAMGSKAIRNDLGYLSFATCRENAEVISNGDMEFCLENAGMINSSFSRATLIIGGYPVFISKDMSWEEMREEVLQLSDECSLMGATILVNLEKTLDTRQQRREPNFNGLKNGIIRSIDML